MKAAFILIIWMICLDAMAQNSVYAYVLPEDNMPVKIYSDSCKTNIVKTIMPEDFKTMQICVPLRYISSEMIGDKVWITEFGETLPESEGWVEKRHCYRVIRSGHDNISHIYAKPDRTSPYMELLSSRGLMANVVGHNEEWLKVIVLYHKPVIGWVNIVDLKP